MLSGLNKITTPAVIIPADPKVHKTYQFEGNSITIYSDTDIFEITVWNKDNNYYYKGKAKYGDVRNNDGSTPHDVRHQCHLFILMILEHKCSKIIYPYLSITNLNDKQMLFNARVGIDGGSGIFFRIILEKDKRKYVKKTDTA
ncbi:Uncharacterised protein [uncultured archaeon]|nr:Uncharacterised protein [uncultured archaeon]